jgi:hypothetical protein
MLTKQDYISSLAFLETSFGFKCENSLLDNSFELIKYRKPNRQLHLIFDNDGHFRRLYVINNNTESPDYKDTENCYTSDMLELLSNTSERSYNNYFGKNRQDGVYELPKEQRLKNIRDLVAENAKIITGELWPKKSLIDKLYSNKVGYKAKAGWKPDGHLLQLKGELEFLKSRGYSLVIDDSNLPEYADFKWEKTLFFENKNENKKIEILIDYRGQCYLVRYFNNGKASDYIQYNLEDIKRRA